jgi:hypothetical protein
MMIMNKDHRQRKWKKTIAEDHGSAGEHNWMKTMDEFQG